MPDKTDHAAARVEPAPVIASEVGPRNHVNERAMTVRLVAMSKKL